MADNFATFQGGLSSPATGAVAVTPHDTNALAATTRAVYVGGAGALTVTMANGVNATFAAVPAGTTLPIRVTHVLATGTAATSIVALS